MEEFGLRKEDLQYIEALSRVSNLNSSYITQIPLINSLLQIFNTLIENNILQKFFKEITNEGVAEFKQAFEKPLQGVFLPTFEQQKKELEKYDFSLIPQAGLNKYLTGCRHTLGHLDFERKKILNGEVKGELTNWWLELIFVESQKYLLDLGFNFECIPEDYIDNPPSDLPAIRENLKLIKELLDSVGNKDHPMQFRKWLISLAQKIYEKINAFKQTAVTAIAVGLDIDVATATFATIKEYVATHGDISAETQNLIKDVAYVEEMLEMETIFSENINKSALKLSNVVPVSGLILSSFYRQENIHQTILELFDRPAGMPEKSESEGESTTPRAIPEEAMLHENHIMNELTTLVERIQDAANKHDWDSIISLAQTAKKCEQRLPKRKDSGPGAATGAAGRQGYGKIISEAIRRRKGTVLTTLPKFSSASSLSAIVSPVFAPDEPKPEPKADISPQLNDSM